VYSGDGEYPIIFHRFFSFVYIRGLLMVFSARCNIYISRLCYDASVRLSVRLSVTEVHWRIIANLARSAKLAKLPEGLYILPMFFLYFFLVVAPGAMLAQKPMVRSSPKFQDW